MSPRAAVHNTTRDSADDAARGRKPAALGMSEPGFVTLGSLLLSDVARVATDARSAGDHEKLSLSGAAIAAATEAFTQLSLLRGEKSRDKLTPFISAAYSALNVLSIDLANDPATRVMSATLGICADQLMSLATVHARPAIVDGSGKEELASAAPAPRGLLELEAARELLIRAWKDIQAGHPVGITVAYDALRNASSLLRDPSTEIDTAATVDAVNKTGAVLLRSSTACPNATTYDYILKMAVELDRM